MLDIHPEPEPSPIEVQAGDRRLAAGLLHDPSLIDDIHATTAVLASVIEAGYFVRECVTTYDFVYHFDSVDEWLAYMAAFWAAAIIDPDVVARARSLQQAEGGELRIRQRMYAARLRKVC